MVDTRSTAQRWRGSAGRASARSARPLQRGSIDVAAVSRFGDDRTAERRRRAALWAALVAVVVLGAAVLAAAHVTHAFRGTAAFSGDQ